MANTLDRVKELQKEILDLKLNQPLQHEAIRALQVEMDQLIRKQQGA
jgi:hypothetical protein